MIDIPKKYGKIMIVKAPQYISRTCHKRHYYMVDNAKAWKIYNEIVRIENERGL